MLQAHLTFLITAAAVKAEIEGQNLRQFDLLRFQCPLHGEQLSSGRKGFIPGRTINRTPGDAVSALGTGEDIVRDTFKTLRSNRNTLPKLILRDDGKEFEKEPLGCREFEIKDIRME